jgi:hypothetical protein
MSSGETLAAKNIFTILCDDIRQEQGHKVSLMGVYGDVILLREIPHAMRLSIHQRWTGLPKSGKMQIGIRGPGLTLPILSIEYQSNEKLVSLPSGAGEFADFSLTFNQVRFTSEGEHKIICFFDKNEHDPEFVQRFYVKMHNP